MELYIHIPFCKSKCQYCDFVSFQACDGEIDLYLRTLNKEILLSGEKFKDRTIDTIFIGGGTPSILSIEQLGSLVGSLYSSFNISKDCEFTIECNPESISEDKLIFYKKLGINRLSMGIQSLDDNNLKEIGRIHNSIVAVEKLKLANEYFDNLSCDLIIGLPYDSQESIKKEVSFLSQYVSHISMYELILEEGTKLYNRVTKGEIRLPDDDMVVDLFNTAIKEAKSHNLFRYEVSNFAKNNMYSKHNYGYWTREEYLGIGLNSSSLIKSNKENRFANFKNIDMYLDSIKNANSYDEIVRETDESLSVKDIENEEIMLALRTTKGIKKELIQDKITKDISKYFIEKDGYLSLTDDGMSIMNSILVEIMQ